MTDKQVVSAADEPSPQPKTRTKKAHPPVDRAALASVIGPRVNELVTGNENQQPLTKAQVAKMAECGESTLRNMANGTGDSYFSRQLLRGAARGLGLPESEAEKAFYPDTPDDKKPSETELLTREIKDWLEPRLARIDEVQQDVATLQETVKGAIDAIHEVNSKLPPVIDISRVHPTE
jgi:hypothetical protein